MRKAQQSTNSYLTLTLLIDKNDTNGENIYLFSNKTK